MALSLDEARTQACLLLHSLDCYTNVQDAHRNDPSGWPEDVETIAAALVLASGGVIPADEDNTVNADHD